MKDFLPAQSTLDRIAVRFTQARELVDKIHLPEKVTENLMNVISLPGFSRIQKTCVSEIILSSGTCMFN